MDIRLNLHETTYQARREAPGDIVVTTPEGGAEQFRVVPLSGGRYAVETGTGMAPVEAVRDGDTVWVRFRGRTYRFELDGGRKKSRSRGGGDLSSPMPGQVQKILVTEGAEVEAHQALLIVEAMKMQLEIKAPHPGTVKRILAAVGEQIEAGVELVELAEQEKA